MMVSPLVVVLVLALQTELVSTTSVNYTCLSIFSIPSSTQAVAVANCLNAAGTSLSSATLKSCTKSTKTKDKIAKKATKLFLKCLTAYHKAAEKLDKKSPGVVTAVQKCLATYGSYAKCLLVSLAPATLSKQALKADAKWSGKKCSNVITTTICATSSSSATTTVPSRGGSTTASGGSATSAPGAVGNCAATSTGTGSLMTAAAMTGALNYHNNMRASILAGSYLAYNTRLGPATSLPPLTWNCSLAASAQTWANGCVFQHDSNRGNVGENLYIGIASTPADLTYFFPPDQLGVAASTSWDGEFMNNPISTLVMDASTVLNTFGHATQMVWSTSTQVGCGVATPCSYTGGQVMSLVVCRYAPPGNTVGQQPFQPKCSGAVASNGVTCA